MESVNASVTVELLGVPRLLAQIETVTVPLESPLPLQEFVRLLAGAVPVLVGKALTSEADGLLPGYVLCRNAREFLSDPEALIHPGESLLLLTNIAGGAGT